MREIFTDKNFIRSKTLLVIKFFLIVSLIVFFLPLIILAFFNHPFADDYICGYQLAHTDFYTYQLSIYNHWGGRFAATFIGSLFAKNNFLYSHYYFHSLLLLAANFLSLLFAINALNKYFLKYHWKFWNGILVSLILFALEICSMVQLSTFIFWFSSAITYQLPIVLMQIEIALITIVIHTKNKTVRILYLILLPFLVFLINGFNELFIVVQLFLFLFVFYFGVHKKFPKPFISVVALLFIISAGIVVFAPGNISRNSIIEPKGIYLGAVAICYHSAETLWSILKNPFTWFTALIVFGYGKNCGERFANSLWLKKINKRKLAFPLIIIFFLLLSIGLAVAGLKGGVIPDRYLNAVAYFVLLLLLMYVFILGTNSNIELSLSKPDSAKKNLQYSLLIVGLLCNTYIVDAYKSVISAPLYNSIMNERESTLKLAAQNNTTAVVEDYNTAIEQHLNTDYKESSVTLRSLVAQKPPFLFFQDDLVTEYSINVLKNFFGVDSIVVKGMK
jgi:Family of unknown function (DUF6056)